MRVTLHDCNYDGGETPCACTREVDVNPDWFVVVVPEQPPRLRAVSAPNETMRYGSIKKIEYRRETWLDGATGREQFAWVHRKETR